MKIDYIKLSPTGNITLLVTTPVPRAQQAAIAAMLLDDSCVGGEQVGYIEQSPSGPRLQMMGGEFCGNAVMSLGAVLARNAGLPNGERMDFCFEVSGSDAPVPCRIARDGDLWVGRVRMPPPLHVSSFALALQNGLLTVPLVELPGIAHLIIPADAGLSEDTLHRLLPDWQRAIGCDALGALIWEEGSASINPLVYVPSSGTLVREHGCGSGSAAIGCWLAHRAGSACDIDVRQPGGVIAVHAEVKGSAVTAVTITGRVALLHEGTVTVMETQKIHDCRMDCSQRTER